MPDAQFFAFGTVSLASECTGQVRASDIIVACDSVSQKLYGGVMALVGECKRLSMTLDHWHISSMFSW
jgi:hypothetical protein